MKNLIDTLREYIDAEEVFYFLGLVLLGYGCAVVFGVGVSAIVLGAVLIATAFWMVRA